MKDCIKQHIKSYYRRYILIILILIFAPSVIEMYLNQSGWIWSLVSWMRDTYIFRLFEKPIMEMSLIDLCMLIAVISPGYFVVILLKEIFQFMWEKNKRREMIEQVGSLLDDDKY